MVIIHDHDKRIDLAGMEPVVRDYRWRRRMWRNPFTRCNKMKHDISATWHSFFFKNRLLVLSISPFFPPSLLLFDLFICLRPIFYSFCNLRLIIRTPLISCFLDCFPLYAAVAVFYLAPSLRSHRGAMEAPETIVLSDALGGWRLV